MPTSVKHFTSAQSGSPVVSRTAGTLIAMLDACLVDGYGLKSVDSIVVASDIATVTINSGHSAIAEGGVMLIAGATPAGLNGEKKVLSVSTTTFTFATTGISNQTATGSITAKVAPAGWTKVYSGTNKAVYRSSDVTSTQSYLRVDDSNVEYARPTGYLTMTDVDTGINPFGTSAYWLRTHSVAGTRPWWVVANKSMVYFGIKTHGVLASDAYSICAFGDIKPRRVGDPYRAIVSGSYYVGGNWSSNAPAISTLIYALSSGGTEIARNFTQLGGAVIASVRSSFAVWVSSGAVADVPFPNGGDNSVVLAEAHVCDYASKTLRGTVPGLYVCPQMPNGAIGNDFVIDSAADFPGKKLLWKLTGSISTYGGCAIDVTGPWA